MALPIRDPHLHLRVSGNGFSDSSIRRSVVSSSVCVATYRQNLRGDDECGSIAPLCFVFTLLFFVINVSIAGDAQACQHPGPTIDDWSSGLTATSESSFPGLAS